MATTIITKNSSTAGAAPTAGDLVQGELAVNVTDKALYTENASGTVVKLNTPSIVDNGNATAITIDSSENVGVGVTPSAWGSKKALEVGNAGSALFSVGANQNYLTSNSYFDGAFKYGATGTATAYQQYAGTHAWLNATSGSAGGVITFTQAMTLDASGNLGIGTSSPTKRISVVDNQNLATGAKVSNTNSGSTAQAAWEFSNGTNTHSIGISGASYSSYGVITANSAFLYAGGGCDIAIGADGGGAIKFGTGGSIPERARIDSSGNLLVGTTSSIGSGKQTISYVGSSYNGIVLSESANTANTAYAVFANGSTAIGSVVRVGSTSAVVYNTTSDQRLKSNIEDAVPVLDKLMSVKVRQYDWTDGDLHQDYGFIAQELEPVFSGIVTKGKTEEDVWQLDYSRLTPHLVKAIQELKAELDSNKREFDAYKATHP